MPDAIDGGLPALDVSAFGDQRAASMSKVKIQAGRLMRIGGAKTILLQ